MIFLRSWRQASTVLCVLLFFLLRPAFSRASCLPNCQSRLFLRNKTTISVESTVGVILEKTTKVTRSILDERAFLVSVILEKTSKVTQTLLYCESDFQFLNLTGLELEIFSQ
jgi:hypothetical protein